MARRRLPQGGRRAPPRRFARGGGALVGDAAVVVAATAAVVVAMVVSAATAPGAAAQAAAGGRPCNATKMEVQFYYKTLRVFLGTTPHWEQPDTTPNVTHFPDPTDIPAGTRIGLTGHRDTAPDLHAMAMRVDWAPESAGGVPGEPLLSSTAWEVARVSKAFAETFVNDAPPASAWSRAVDVSASVNETDKLYAPVGAAHVAAAAAGAEDADAKYWVAFRSPPTPAGGACSSFAAADDGSSLSAGVMAVIGIVAVVLLGAVIGGVVWALRGRQRRRTGIADVSDAEWPAKPASGGGGGGGGGGGEDDDDGDDADRRGGPGGRHGEPVATPAAGSPAYAARGGRSDGAAGGGGDGGGAFPAAGGGSPRRDGRLDGGGVAPPSDHFSVSTAGSPAVDSWVTCEDIRAQAVAAQALEADVAAAAQALYEDTVVAGGRLGGRDGGGAPATAGGVVSISSGGVGGRGGRSGGGGELPDALAMHLPTLTTSSGGTGTLGTGSAVTDSLESPVGLPRTSEGPPRVKRGVALPDDDDDGLSPPPLPPSLWTPLPSPGV
ncbi:hypothetical protein I4F81_001166 [Pyropia yezoensis]|uniref:Uncharacterized protein n=1 Tax=Pyropia yezoensis TaxID=2788 RepID=A0ACC3BKU6_PYRYE|nr:hypothetical protein I4F81_001166 [Neopyropia yezoensis]